MSKRKIKEIRSYNPIDKMTDQLRNEKFISNVKEIKIKVHGMKNTKEIIEND